MTASTMNGEIFLRFDWKGPTEITTSKEQGTVGVVDLIFNSLNDQISVDIPSNLSSDETLSFTRKCLALQKVTHPPILMVTIGLIQNLTIRAGIFGKTSLERTNHEVPLALPENLEVGKKYCLVITSRDLKASLIKEEIDPERAYSRLASVVRTSLLSSTPNKSKLEDYSQKALVLYSYEELLMIQQCAAKQPDSDNAKKAVSVELTDMIQQKVVEIVMPYIASQNFTEGYAFVMQRPKEHRTLALFELGEYCIPKDMELAKTIMKDIGEPYKSKIESLIQQTESFLEMYASK